MRIAQKNIASLPTSCYGILPVDGSIIKIIAGESGYYPLTGMQDSAKRLCKTESVVIGKPFTMEDFADKMNAKEGITKAQRKAMEWGSQFGWDTGLADPTNYDENGRPYCEVNPRPVMKSKTNTY